MDTISNEKISSNEKAVAETAYGGDKLPGRLLAVSEVARFLGVHTSTVRRWEKEGLLKSYAIGLRNNLRFKQEDVLSFLDQCRKTDAFELEMDGDLDEGTKAQSGKVVS